VSSLDSRDPATGQSRGPVLQPAAGIAPKSAKLCVLQNVTADQFHDCRSWLPEPPSVHNWGVLIMAGSGGCPYSPKADLGKKWHFSSVRLRTQLRTHTLGRLRPLALLPESGHSPATTAYPITR
jgi:hypothetical protein